MIETILAIEEVHEGERWNSYSGYAIHTDKQVIKLLIDNEQSCCEDWGYFFSEDNLEKFIGAQLVNLTITDTALNTQKMVDVYEGGIMFVDISTSKGVLQFVAYNAHNGYYGHEAKIVSQQLTHSEYI